MTYDIRQSALLALHNTLYESMGQKKVEDEEYFLHPILLNFDQAYCGQEFYKQMKYHWIDCTDMKGCSCYCDEEAKQKIRTLIQPYPINGIHYIDSGNYHYVSQLWLEKVREPFILVVFDHHTDMQPSLFQNLLSCGCWVKQVIDTNPYLRKVFLVGAKEELIQQIPNEYTEKVICYSEKTCIHEKSWKKYFNQYEEIPFYISIDKDVLTKSEVMTNWDQGSMTMVELEAILRHILYKHQVLGVDICGEYIAKSNLVNECKAQKLNNRANQKLLDLIVSGKQVNCINE